MKHFALYQLGEFKEVMMAENESEAHDKAYSKYPEVTRNRYIEEITEQEYQELVE